MKILHITPYYPPHLGGVEGVAQRLNEALASRGKRITVLTSKVGHPKGMPLGLNKEGLVVKTMHAIEIGHTPISPSFPIRFLAEIGKADLVHVHAGVSFYPELSVFFARLANKPVVVTFHCDTEPSGKLGFLLPAYNNSVLKWVLNNATAVVCLTEDQASVVEKKYRVSKKKVHVIPNGIEEFFLHLRHQKKFEPALINLLFVGRFARQKNIPRLLDAVKILSKEFAVKLRLVGKGEEEEKIRRIAAQSGLEKSVEFCGVFGKTKSDLEKWETVYNASDVFVCSSDYEGLPLAMLEAMAVGIPVVATDVRGVREFAKDCAVLCDPDPVHLAQAIKKTILDEKLQKKITANAIQKTRDYSWQRIAEKFEELYAGVLK